MIRKGFFNYTFIVLTFVLTLLVSSCVPSSPSSSRKNNASNSSGTTDTNPGTPDFSDTNNYFQTQETSTSNSLSLAIDYTNNVYLRGKQVDYFVKNNPNEIQCLVAYIPGANTAQVTVFAATPKYTTNLATNTREYYYSIAVSGEEVNKTFCQKTGLINSLSATYAAVTTYKLSGICSTCSSLNFASREIRLYSNSGNIINDVKLSNLVFNIRTSTTGDSSNTCSSNTTCTAQGYSCCLQGQCVNDRTLRSGVNTSSSEFLQALHDISLNSNNIYKYPNFYNLCGSASTDPSEGPSDGDGNPEDEAVTRLNNLKNLYNCTTPIEGEMSVCTLSFANASNDSDLTFQTQEDDRSFASLVPANTTSITEILYQGKTLFNSQTVPASGVTIGPGNDDVVNVQSVVLTQPKDPNITDDTLLLRYMIDGSCEKLNNSLAKCTKYYVQGQNLGKVTDHFPGTNDFALPLYADYTKTIEVRVDGQLRQQGTHFTLIPGGPSIVRFSGSGTQVFDQQDVEIIYYVDISIPSNQGILKAKMDALREIDKICSCPNLDCRLKPVYKNDNESLGIITDFTCKYKDNSVPAPLQVTVNLDSRSAPHRHFDMSGTGRNNLKLSDIIETPSLEQEGNAFIYTGGNKFKPNNVSQYIGFNEIYGSFTYKTGSGIAAKMVEVEKGVTYDITVGNGTFSNCTTCGNDYHALLRQIFPKSFDGYGGGYVPDQFETSASGTSKYRADDLIFGRACFMPATMLPWSHAINADVQSQRQDRLAAQHFYFANGYQRDWYGFDYGSVIGSFDGVRWFSIGNARRIEAKSNKLFLAINAYYSDLTIQNNFQVLIRDSIITSNTDFPTTDFETTGAQCQAQHICTADSDCAAKLGWDYVCESVTNIKSNYPRFDSSGNELPEISSIEKLLSLNGSFSGEVKRCVYRGKGAPCITNYTTGDETTTFNGASSPRLLGCAPNYYCQPFFESGTYQARFNNKIARFPMSVIEQNDSSDVAEDDLDSFGKGSRILGRPFKFIGDEIINTFANGNISNNGVNGICLPGREPGSAGESLVMTNYKKPRPTDLSDLVNGIGMTATDNGPNRAYLSSCVNFDQTNNQIHFQSGSYGLAHDNANIVNIAASQSIPTNSLKILESLAGVDILKDFENDQILDMAFQENRCLRAPGSTCHTDNDCAANPYISGALSGIDPDLAGVLNPYEVKFWQETLVCSQPKRQGEEGYDQTLNRCCRLPGNEITIPTSIDGDNIVNVRDVAGVDIALNSSTRYTRNSATYFKRNNAATASSYLPMEVAADNQCNTACKSTTTIAKQFNTVDEAAGRTCCSENWIRNFADGSHEWGPTKMQRNIPYETLECYNWVVDPNRPSLTCADIDNINENPECHARQVSTSDASPILEWLGSMELTGIPQVGIKSNDFTELRCVVNPTNSSVAGTEVPAIFVDTAKAREYTNGAQSYYSASFKTDNNFIFEDDKAKVFSEDSFSCCQPAGTQMKDGDSPSLCCTGHINPSNKKCALKNYSNVSVYTNRYVSSEAKGINEAQFEELTGFIKSPSLTIQLACEKQMCASGLYGYGVVYGEYKIRGKTSENDPTILRFFSSRTEDNDRGQANFIDEGLRWNNHVYCIPEDFQDLEGSDNSYLKVFSCN